MQETQVYTSRASYVTTNKMLKNTYVLLSATIIFSAICALLSMSMQIGSGTSFILIVVAFGLLVIAQKTANNASGLFWVFAFTGVEGLSLGPILSHYTHMNAMIVPQAFGLTAAIFILLSFYAITTKKDFSFMGGFLFVGLIIVIIASVLSLFFPSIGGVWISAVASLIFVGLILFDTSRIINGGETNYIRATISLYLDFLNLFLQLLRLLGSSRN